MSDSPTVPIVDPSGKVWDIPYEQMHSALDAGGKMGVYMNDPQGKQWVIPADKTQDALKSGGKIVPYNLDQSHQKQGFWSTLGADLKGLVTNFGAQNPYPGMGQDEKAAAAGMAYDRGQVRKEAGYGPGYRAVAPIAESIGVNVPGMEQSAAAGDTAGVMGHAVAGASPLLAAEAGKGIVKGVKVAADALPSTERAGANFQKVMGAAKSIPVDVSGPGKVALDINKLADSGGSMPKVVRDFIKRVTDPDKPELTYEELRNFQSNASRLSADEYGRLTPVMRRKVGEFSAELNRSAQDAAGRVGKLQQFNDAMTEYRNAMQLRDAKDAVVNKAIDYLKVGVPGAVGAYAAKRIILGK